jgi:hypothetical protein
MSYCEPKTVGEMIDLLAKHARETPFRIVPVCESGAIDDVSLESCELAADPSTSPDAVMLRVCVTTEEEEPEDEETEAEEEDEEPEAE